MATGAAAGAAGTSVIIKPVVELIVRAIPTGFSLIRSLWMGKEILIIGQARAGKTTIREYLQYGLFDDEKETEETPDIVPTSRFDVELGRNSNLKLVISTAVDTAGQVGGVQHANLAYSRNPHALMIVLDVTTPLTGKPDRASASWLRRFCKRYEALWRVNRKRSNRIRSIVIVMNKVDQVAPSEVASRKAEYRKIIDDELRDGRGRILGEIAILPCSAVTNPDGTKLIDGVIAHLAQSFAR